MKVFALSKFQFDKFMYSEKMNDDNVEDKKKTCFISINETVGRDKYDELKPYFTSNKSNLLIQYFDDVEEDIPFTIVGSDKQYMTKAFTRIQGEEMVEFLTNNIDKDLFIVHCAAGISRSGAVATFINNYFQGDKIEFEKNNPHILPNGTVLSMLNRIVKEKYYDDLSI